MTISQRESYVRENRLNDPNMASIDLHNQFVFEMLMHQALRAKNFKVARELLKGHLDDRS